MKGNMEKLRDTVMELARSEWGEPLSASQVTHIERCLLQAFPVVRTPTHPTYALMIESALQALGPSTEDSVVEYIKANFEDLPWAHRSYTRHHLNRLCERGSIMFSADKHYEFLGLNHGTRSSSFSRLNPDGQAYTRPVERLDDARPGECLATLIQDDAEENIKVTGKRNHRRVRRTTVVSDDEDDEPEEVGVPGGETRCAPIEGEIQVSEKDRELKYLENGACDNNVSVQELFIRRSEGEVPPNHQTGVPNGEIRCAPDECEIQVSEKDRELKYLENGACDNNVNVQELFIRRFEGGVPAKHQAGVPNGEICCAPNECEIQVNEKDRELRYLENGVCHKDGNVQKLSIIRSEGGDPAKHQADLLIKEPSIAKKAQEELHDKTMSQLIKLIQDQLKVSECHEERRTELVKFRGDASGPKLLTKPEKVKSSRGRRVSQRKKNQVENETDTVLICGLSAESQKQDKQKIKVSRKRAKLVHEQQHVLKLTYHSSPPSSDLPEAQVLKLTHHHSLPNSDLPKARENEYVQNRSPELNLPLVLYKKNLRSTPSREKAEAVDLEKRKWLIGVQSLVKSSFFHQCKSHEGGCPTSRSRCNWFCLQCMNEAFCVLCLEKHRMHPVVKIKLTVYGESVDVNDAKKANLDISGIETHFVNGMTSVSLSRKTLSRTRKGKGETKQCVGCERHVYIPFNACSLRCKNQIMMGASELPRKSRGKTSVA